MLNKYIIKENGTILSTYRGCHKELSSSTCKKGYHRVTLTQDNGIKKTFLLHRLIALDFIPNPKDLPQVNHIDGNKDNNQSSNLEWVTNLENTEHAVSLGLIPLGNKRSNSNLTAKAIRKLRALREEGLTYYELGRLFNIAYQTAHKICVGITYKHIK